MKILRGRKVLITNIVAIMMLFAVGIFAFGSLTTAAYAQEDETIRDGYTMEGIQELLNENNALSSTGTRDLQIYSQNGIMNTIEVPKEEEESSTQSLIQPMAAPSFTTQALIDSGRNAQKSYLYNTIFQFIERLIKLNLPQFLRHILI